MKGTTILGIACLIILPLALVLFLGSQSVEPFTGIYDTVAGWFTGADLGSVVSNPTALATTALGAAGSAAAVGIPLYNSLKTAKQKVESTASAAKTEIDSAKNQLGSLNDKLTSTTNQLDTANLNLTEANKKIEDLTKQANSATELKNQLSTAQNNYSNLLSVNNSLKSDYETMKIQLKTAQDQLAILRPPVK